jgi:excisionase family DNA binding protein
MTITTTDERLPALLTVPRAASLLGISRASAYRYAAAGELPIRRLGGRVYVITARLLAMVDKDET